MSPVILFEVLAFAAALAGAALLRRRGRLGGWAERPFSRLCGLPVPAPFTAFCVTLALAACLSAIRPPAPSIHDELSYLLAADTFASGRLTNPPHPLWRHFETIQVLQQPTYQSRYPPGQGLALALGRVATGYFIVGAWLSAAAASAALCWALAAWMPARWALFGSLLPIVRFGSLGVWDSIYYAYWTATYWGGSLTLLGAALAFGAAPRLWRAARARDAALFAAGLSVLAVTRPYEGLVLAVPLCLICAAGIWKAREWSALGAAAAVLLLAGAGLAHYNRRVTGSPLVFPYLVYGQQYDVARNFKLQPLRAEPAYRIESMRRYHTGYMMEGYRAQQENLGLDRYETRLLGRFYLGLVLAPVFLLGLAWESGWRTLSAALLALGIGSHMFTGIETLQPHYFAPFTPALLLLTVQGLRRLKVLGRNRKRAGLAAAQAVIFVCGASFVFAAGLRAFVLERRPNLGERRAAIAAQLDSAGGVHVVFVRYAGDHDINAEWVYNGADIDSSPVVWAQDLSEAENRQLIGYFPDRRAWVVFPDEKPPRLEPYSAW
jgi:hypothetical protein